MTVKFKAFFAQAAGYGTHTRTKNVSPPLLLNW